MKKKLTEDELLKKMDELLKNSELTEEDAIEIGKKIKHEIAKKHHLINDENK